MLLFSIFILGMIPCLSSLPFICPSKLTNDDLNCSMTVGDFRNASFPELHSLKNKTKLKIVSFNIDRNGGVNATRNDFLNIIRNLAASNMMIYEADVFFVSEIARDCQEFGEYVDGPQEMAQSLGLSYAYAVEYVTDYKEGNEHQCTMGNAIFSKFALNNVEQIRFENQCCKFDGRWGGRVAVSADIMIKGKVLSMYSTHLESGQDNFFSVIHGNLIRYFQMVELVRHLNEKKTDSDYAMIGGDFNAPLGMFDMVSLPLMLEGFKDSHFSMSFLDRTTCPVSNLDKYGVFLFDYIWVKGKVQFHNRIVCNRDFDVKCAGLSDHYPIGVDLYLCGA